ncbi:MAG: hypothetical protein V3V20_11830 [Algisphaera sp.]
MNIKPADSLAAQATWWTLTLASGAALLGLAAIQTDSQLPTKAWFIVPSLWLLFAVPATFMLHGHAFLSPSTSHHAPLARHGGGDALHAARSLWGVLALGVALSLVAAIVSAAASPSMWPGAVMFMLLILARPTASAPTPQNNPSSSGNPPAKP